MMDKIIISKNYPEIYNEENPDENLIILEKNGDIKYCKIKDLKKSDKIYIIPLSQLKQLNYENASKFIDIHREVGRYDVKDFDYISTSSAKNEYSHFYDCEDGYAGEEISIKLRNLKFSKLKDHVISFFNSMRGIFVSYDECYIPIEISEIEIRVVQIHACIKNKNIYFKKLNNERREKEKEYKNYSAIECIELSYGVSGGLHLCFSEYFLKKGTIIPYIL